MGACLSICSGKAAEAKKSTAFQTLDTDGRHSESAALLQDDRSHLPPRDSDDGGGALSGASSSLLLDSSAGATGSSSQLDTLDSERLKSFREEQARLDLLVATTGRDMVAVRSTRGSTGYYDQGFAAALAQHLEQTTEFPNQLPQRLPPPPLDLQELDKSTTNHHIAQSTATASSSSTANNSTTTTSSSASALYAILSQPMWEGIVLGPSREGLAGCGGENPGRYLDRVAESILDAAVPTKEELFAGLGPMVENLL